MMRDFSKQLVRNFLVLFDFSYVKINLSFIFHFPAALFSNPTLLLDLAKNFDYAAPIIFYYDHHNNATQDAVTAKVKDFYFRGGLTKQNLLNLTSVMSL